MFLAVIAAGAMATSCSSDDDDKSVNSKFTLDLNEGRTLSPLGAEYVYEGWIIVDGAPVSTGTFTSVDFPQTFSVNADMLSQATRFVLSIEPADDPDPAPAATKVLVGDFSGDTAALTTGGVVGDFSNAAGAFFMRTPTDEVPGSGNNGNDEYGVWFGTPGAPPTSNFVLPTLAPGWAYEGWVVGETGPISTGVFTDFDGRDDFNMFSGEEFKMGPPVPGEDFFLNAPEGEMFPLDVRGKTVVISVEPVPDDSPAPYVMKPLVGKAGQETAPATHDFSQNLESLPSGVVTR